VSDELFPSGPWIGFYAYCGRKDRHRMDLALDFANGIISGEGNDDLGAFVVRGRFDAATKECHWTKTYVGGHDVYYDGFREGKGIWGTWEIPNDVTGGFKIWPLASGGGDDDAESEEKGEPVEAVGELVGVGALEALGARSDSGHLRKTDLSKHCFADNVAGDRFHSAGRPAMPE